MSLNASFFLAMRYLKPQRSFVSIITLLAVLGPVLGVAVLIVVIAVMAGFQRDIRARIFDVQAHVQLRSQLHYIADPQPMLVALREAGCRAVPTVEGPALVQTRTRVAPKIVKGMDPADGKALVQFSSKMVQGEFRLGDDEAVVGESLARELGLHIGEKLIIHPTGKLEKRIRINADGELEPSKDEEDMYVPEEVTVVGIFKLGMYEADSSLVLVNLDKADTVFDLPWGSAQSIQIWADDPFKLDPVLELIESKPKIFHDVNGLTWYQLNADYFAVLETEKQMQFFLLIFIMVVAGFSIMATLITVVIQKTREIGMLKALGTNPLAILMLFLMQGGIVGTIGVTLGTTLGLSVVRWRGELMAMMKSMFGIDFFPEQYYSLPVLPAEVVPHDVFLIVLSAFLICIFAAVIPAAYAASMTPCNALRSDA